MYVRTRVIAAKRTMAPSPGRTPRKKRTDARRGVKDLVLTFYAEVEEAVPRVSGQKRTEKDKRNVRKWEKIGKELQGERYSREEKTSRKSLERTLSRGPEQSEAGSNQGTGGGRPVGQAENPIGGSVEATLVVKCVGNSDIEGPRGETERDIDRAENPIGGSVEVTFAVKRVENSDIKVPRGEIERDITKIEGSLKCPGEIDRDTEERYQGGLEEDEYWEEEPTVEDEVGYEWRKILSGGREWFDQAKVYWESQLADIDENIREFEIKVRNKIVQKKIEHKQWMNVLEDIFDEETRRIKKDTKESSWRSEQEKNLKKRDIVRLMLRKTSKGKVKTLRIVLNRGKKYRGGQKDVGRNILLKMACIEEYRSKQAQGLQEVI